MGMGLIWIVGDDFSRIICGVEERTVKFAAIALAAGRGLPQSVR
jgi:hypothetical protein